MSATNLTDIGESLSNSTVNNSVSGPVDTWETRLQAEWPRLFGHIIGSVLSFLIIYFSIFSKHITGDYKWFVLNQAVSSFSETIGHIAYTLVIYVLYTPDEHTQLYYGNDTPLWMYIHGEAVILLLNKMGFYAQMTTLFATVFNRWMAIVMPGHYQKYMSARLIVLYCILCYVVTIPTDHRLIFGLQISSAGQLLISIIFPLIPWTLSIILSVLTFFKLWNHMRTTTTITDKRRLQESRMVLYSLMIQIAVVLFEKIPYYIYQTSIIIWVSTGKKDILNNPLIVVFTKICRATDMYTNALTCVVIFITMRPYRRALLSLISPITKFCQHHLKPNVTPKTTNNRVTPNPNVVNVQPARRANSP